MEPLSAQQREFVERFAAHLAPFGLPRMPARVLGLFVCADREALSASDVIDALGISQAAASPALRSLVSAGLLEWTPSPGSRRDHYRITQDAWIDAVALRQRQYADLAELARVGSRDLPAGGPAAARLARMEQFYDFLATELPALVQRWQARTQ